MSNVSFERCADCVDQSQFEAVSAVAGAGSRSVERLGELADTLLQRFSGLQDLHDQMPPGVSPEQREHYEAQFAFMEGMISLAGSMSVWAEMSVADMCSQTNAADCATAQNSKVCPRAALLLEISASLASEAREQEVELQRRLSENPDIQR